MIWVRKEFQNRGGSAKGRGKEKSCTKGENCNSCCLCTWSELAIPKPSTTAYHSHWFCIFKSNGKTLCLVHDLQPLNTITIYDSSAPPFIKHFAESFARFTVYCMLDFHYRFNQHPLDSGSHNFTTFNSPMGSMHLITVPTRYTNAVQIY